MGARDRALGGRRVASTLVTVPALARPEWKVEIAVVAAVSRRATRAGSPPTSSEECCDITTTGRRSGRPHEIEIWFSVAGDTLYLVSGNGVDVRLVPQRAGRTGRDGAPRRRGAPRRGPHGDDADERRLVGELMDAKYPSYADESLGLTHQRWCFEVPALAIGSWSPAGVTADSTTR